jgi:Protein of unknown function (DUF732)
MKKIIIGGLAALTIELGVAPVAGADANNREFIEATDQVVLGNTGWIEYPKVPVQLRIDTAHAVCDMLDGGALSANDFIVAAFDDRRQHAGYLAAWFQQIAITYYCPRHSDKIGSI